MEQHTNISSEIIGWETRMTQKGMIELKFLLVH